jgi:two-component system sensor histidine kinase QseC
VRATVTREGDRVSLRVEDSGPGMSDADLARLGERFFRALGTEESGSGLGWSIVRRIAATHGMEVTVARSEALGGLVASVETKAD